MELERRSKQPPRLSWEPSSNHDQQSGAGSLGVSANVVLDQNAIAVRSNVSVPVMECGVIPNNICTDTVLL
jgi:hypothetical protein